MEREILVFSPLDPEIVQARETAGKLLREFYACEDPFTKETLGKMFYDEIFRMLELRRKSQVREEVKNLHDLEYPQISLN
jgi:hypothetical protein